MFLRHFLRCIVIFGAVVTPTVFGLDIICTGLNLLNIIRCKTPLVNAGSSPLNCITDCVCIHGFTNATCDTNDGLCKCYNENILDEDQLAHLRMKTCGTIIQQGLQVIFMQALCPDGSDGTCTDDCKCGHDALSGNCNDQGYTLNGNNYKLCECKY